MTVELGTIADAADALTNPIHVREPIPYWDSNRNRKTRYHVHTLPSLVDQLQAAVVPGEAYVEDQGGHVRTTPRSIPPARVEAIHACIVIEEGASFWVYELSLTPRTTTAAKVRSLVGASPDSGTAERLLIDLRRWYGLAATLTGWERGPWRPDAPCPLCGVRGLRVRLDRSTATCVSCGEAWTPMNIGLLAEHVRQIADAAADSRRWAGWAQRDHPEQ